MEVKLWNELNDQQAEKASGGTGNGADGAGQAFGEFNSNYAQIYYAPSPSYESSGRLRPGYDANLNPSQFNPSTF